VQGEQEGRFKTVAVLDRHGADDGVRLAVKAKRDGLGPAVLYQLAPGLGLGLRQAG